MVGHIGGTDTFARGLELAHRIIDKTDFVSRKEARYQSFDSGDGARFERGELDLSALRDIAAADGEPEPRSGKQEWYENLINQYL
ncbi:MAG: hypothetical protein AB8B86_06880 [Pseudomonadales bacterium]